MKRSLCVRLTRARIDEICDQLLLCIVFSLHFVLSMRGAKAITAASSRFPLGNPRNPICQLAIRNFRTDVARVPCTLGSPSINSSLVPKRYCRALWPVIGELETLRPIAVCKRCERQRREAKTREESVFVSIGEKGEGKGKKEIGEIS